MNRYSNMILEAKLVSDGARQIQVRVFDSPAGQQRHAETVPWPAELAARLRMLEKRQLTQAELITLGETLGNLLLPPGARQLFNESRGRLDDDEGLRICLRLDSGELTNVPWEYIYLQQRDTPADQMATDGFVALDNRVSLVRFEVIGQPLVSLDPVDSNGLRMVVLLANPLDPRFRELDLDAERRVLEAAVATVPELTAEYVADATIERLLSAFTRGAHIFHFAGHGEFSASLSGTPGGNGASGSLVLVSAAGEAAYFSATKLAMQLRGKGIRLAVLGACHAGRRDGINVWTGVAPALTYAGIPAVVGMQYTIEDTNAIAFSRRFYAALAAGLTIDAAVTEGRLEIFSTSADDDRDWGVPVLYLRAKDGALFPRRDGDPASQPAKPHSSPDSSVVPSTISPGTATAQVNQRALRLALVDNFRTEELELLCDDVKQRLAENGVDLPVSLDVVGGSMQANKVLNLIRYLDTRGYLQYLVDAAREMKPGTV